MSHHGFYREHEHTPHDEISVFVNNLKNEIDTFWTNILGEFDSFSNDITAKLARIDQEYEEYKQKYGDIPLSLSHDHFSDSVAIPGSSTYHGANDSLPIPSPLAAPHATRSGAPSPHHFDHPHGGFASYFPPNPHAASKSDDHRGDSLRIRVSQAQPPRHPTGYSDNQYVLPFTTMSSTPSSYTLDPFVKLHRECTAKHCTSTLTVC